jgi:hypothetical protein
LPPALKTGIFQNGGIPVCHRHWKREFPLDCGSRVLKLFKVFQQKK